MAAGAQGWGAGLNAALSAQGREPAIFSRAQSYIGVMIDDLVSRGVTEPYRMFTSRAEFRLSLRADNADQRLTPLAASLNCVGEERRRAFGAKMELLGKGRAALEAVAFTPREAASFGMNVGQDGQRRTAFTLLSFPEITFPDLVRAAPSLAQIDAATRIQLERDATYANYLDRQRADVDAMRRDEALEIPPDFDFLALAGLSTEIKTKLAHSRPHTIAHASRIEGVTPAALAVLLATIKRQERRRSAG